MRVGIYARVSTEEQAKEGFSIGFQKDRNFAFVESQGWTLHDFYIDEGYSAKDTNRPDLTRLMTDVEQGKIDVVLVFRLDRLTRSVLDLYQLLAFFDKHNVAFKSATEVYDTTSAIGRLFLTLVAALAQWERENLAERVRYGMEQMVKEGKRPGGSAGFGYISVNGQLIKKELESTVVQFIYDEYERSQGIKKIQAKVRDKWDMDLSATQINYMLRNPLYMGKIRWNLRSKSKGKTHNEIVTQGSHEPTVSETQWHRVQKLLDRRRQLPPVAATSDFIFAGIVRCGRCGYSMSGTSRTYKTKRTKYYACVNRQKNFKCDMPYLQEEWIEKSILAHLRLNLDARDISDLEDEIAVTVEQDSNVKRLEELQRELDKIQARKRKFQIMYADGEISRDDFLIRNDELSREEKRTLDLIDEIAITDEGDFDTGELADMIQGFTKTFTSLDDNEKKAICQELFKTIVLNATKQDKNNPPDIQVSVEYN